MSSKTELKFTFEVTVDTDDLEVKFDMKDWNNGYITEGCQTLHIFNSMIWEHLLHHPSIEKAGVKHMVLGASKLLSECYQAVGTLDFDEETGEFKDE